MTTRVLRLIFFADLSFNPSGLLLSLLCYFISPEQMMTMMLSKERPQRRKAVVIKVEVVAALRAAAALKRLVRMTPLTAPCAWRNRRATLFKLEAKCGRVTPGCVQ